MMTVLEYAQDMNKTVDEVISSLMAEVTIY